MPMTVIQWFPGHMAKAKREVQEKLKLIDVAFELLDARLPMSSRNPMIDDILGQKPRLILLNKADMADEAVTEQWIRYFRGQGRTAIAIDAQSGTGVRQIAFIAKEMVKEKFEKMRAKGIKNPRPVRALIVGIPNVGKSTLINRLAGRHIAKTGDKPGV
ncbi:ribosome biogenesis GTPase YlqF, partial [Geobacillus stearothermophilus]